MLLLEAGFPCLSVCLYACAVGIQGVFCFGSVWLTRKLGKAEEDERGRGEEDVGIPVWIVKQGAEARRLVTEVADSFHSGILFSGT